MGYGYYVQVCMNLKSKCVNVEVFGVGGEKIDQKEYCGIEVVELRGIARITVGEHMVNNLMCLNLEIENIGIRQSNSILKIGNRVEDVKH